MSEIIWPNGTVAFALPNRLDTKLVRHGDTAHVRTCSRVQNIEVTAWMWPDGKSRREVLSSIATGMRFCRVCEPLLHWDN